MKKKLLTVFACLAVVVLAGIGLVGCGNTTAHQVSFGDATVNFVTNENYTIKGLKWTQEKDVEGYTGVWKLDGGQTVAKLAKPVNGKDHYVCVTFAGDGADISKVVAKTKATEEAQWGDNINQVATPAEKDFHLLISVTEAQKTVYLSLDWDGSGKEEAQLYKFIIPAGLTLEK